MRDWRSVLRGLQTMSNWHVIFKHWAVRFTISKQFWIHWWTPRWHEERGPYVSIGLGLIRIYRGY